MRSLPAPPPRLALPVLLAGLCLLAPAAAARQAGGGAGDAPAPRGGDGPGVTAEPSARPPVALDPADPAATASGVDPVQLRVVEDELQDESWVGWWTRERGRFLDGLRRGGGGLPTARAPEQAPPRLAALTVEARVVPALVAFLETATDPLERREAYLALGRLELELGLEAQVRAVLERALAERRPEAAAGGLFALAARGSQESVELLLDLVVDGPLARRMRREQTPEPLRVQAALAAGLLAARAENEDVAAWVLKRLLAVVVDRRMEDTIRRAALVGVGAAGDARLGGLHVELARDAWSAQLLRVLDDRGESDRLRGRAAVALARVARPAGEALRDATRERLLGLAGPRTSEALRRGALAGLVLLALGGPDPPHEAVVRALREASETGPLGTRGPAWIGWGRVAATNAEASAAFVEALGAALERKSAPERAWCALALGVHAFERTAAGLEPTPTLREVLVEGLDDERASDVRAALLVACALSGTRPAPERLEELAEAGDARQRAWARFLRLTGPGGGDESALAEELEAHRHDSIELPVLADALACRGAGLAPLLGLVEEQCCPATAATVARALGERGDPRALGALLSVLGDEELVPSARAAAAWAVGRLADARPGDLTRPLALGVEHAAGLPELFDASGAGALQRR